MRSFRFLPAIASTLVGMALAAPPARAADSIQVYYTTPTADIATAQSASTIGAIEQGMLASINGATTSIDVAIYELDRQNIVDALASAKGRGATVRMVTECENRKGGDQAFFDQLAAAGIPIVDDNSSYNGANPSCPVSTGGDMHDKFMIVDGVTLWTGSVNYTSTGFNYNRENAVRVVSASVVAQYQAEFNVMFGNGLPLASGGTGKFSRAKTTGTTSNIVTHSVAGIEVETAFGPTGYNINYSSSRPSGPDTMKLLRTAIFSASSALHFAIFYLDHSQIRSDIVNRKSISQGLIDSVGGMFDGSQFGSLCGKGVTVKNENFPGKVHDKLLVVDAGGASDPQVILGSPNWTSSGFQYNDENMLLVHDATIASAAETEYNALYNDAANVGMECCGHSAEAYNAHSPLDNQSQVAVCHDSLDNDYNGYTDAADTANCGATFNCCGTSGMACAAGGDCCSGTCYNGNPRTCK